MENTNNTTEETTSGTAPSEKGQGPSGATIAIVAVAVVGILGAGYVYMTNKNPDGSFSMSTLFNNESGEAVALVNGEAISRAEYDESLANMNANLEAQGADLSNTELQSQVSTQVLDSLVNTELLSQAAKEGNFTAQEGAVQTEYDALAAQLGGAEALAQQMASVGLTEEELRTDIEAQLGIRAYLSANIATSSLAVTDEEITAFYNSVELPEGEKPALEEVRPQIEEQLRLGKEQEEISKLIEKLRTEAEIEVLI